MFPTQSSILFNFYNFFFVTIIAVFLFFFTNCHLDLRKHFKDHLFVYICLLLIFLFHYSIILSLFSYQFFFFFFVAAIVFVIWLNSFLLIIIFTIFLPNPASFIFFFNDHCLPKSCSVMAGLFASTLLHSLILFFFFFNFIQCQHNPYSLCPIGFF